MQNIKYKSGITFSGILLKCGYTDTVPTDNSLYATMENRNIHIEGVLGDIKGECDNKGKEAARNGPETQPSSPPPAQNAQTLNLLWMSRRGIASCMLHKH